MLELVFERTTNNVLLKNIEMNEEKVPDDRLAYTDNINSEISKINTIIESSYIVMRDLFNE